MWHLFIKHDKGLDEYIDTPERLCYHFAKGDKFRQLCRQEATTPLFETFQKWRLLLMEKNSS